MKSKKQQRTLAKNKLPQRSDATSGEPVLDLELVSELDVGSNDDSNALVLVGSRKRRREEGRQEEPAPVLSKSQKRKLRRLQEEKEARQKRDAVLASLEQHRLSEDQQQLLLSSGAIGQSETLRQKLHRAMQFQKAGLAAPPDSHLFRERVIAEEEQAKLAEDDQEELAELEQEKIDREGLAAGLAAGKREVKSSKGVLLKGINIDREEVSTKERLDGSPKGVVLNGIKKVEATEGLEGQNDISRGQRKQKAKLRISGDDTTEEALEVRRSSGTFAGPSSTDGLDKEGAEKDAGRKKRKKGAEERELRTETESVDKSQVIEAVACQNGVPSKREDAEKSEDVDPLKPSKRTKKQRVAKQAPSPVTETGLPAPEQKDARESSPRDTEDVIQSDNDKKGQPSSQHSIDEIKNQPSSGSKTEPAEKHKPFVRIVQRPADVQEARLGLPILGMEQEIMEAVTEHDVIVICGETGCGKTTQVPQFLFEAGYGSKDCTAHPGAIGVTQPRRVAALATARRVAEVLGVGLGKEVGFQVRYDRRVGEQSAIKFMTDGILLREVQSDFLLRQYSCIIIDEAHERSLNTDVLIGLLSRIVPLRRQLSTEQPDLHPLKLIIMSATLRIEDFVGNERLCPKPPPVVKVSARQFPVTVHFSKRTELIDYVGAAEKKVRAIHKQLPPGGVLVFLTGQREVEDLCKRLRKAFPVRRPSSKRASSGQKSQAKLERKKEETMDDVIAEAADGDEVAGGLGFGRDEEEAGVNGDGQTENEEENQGDGLGLHPAEKADEDKANEEKANEETAKEEKENEEKVNDEKVKPDDELLRNEGSGSEEDDESPGPLHVLPLYAMLPAKAQLRVFGDPPEGHRLVVVATNVAETSLTIPGIRYVIDCGRAKERTFERGSGLSKFEVNWISKASADQRAGRAGRVGPGHCYRLYSSALFNDQFPQHAPPEIESAPIEGVVLQMKAMGIEKVVNFPFPTPPDRFALSTAERTLISLSALHARSTLITQLGKSMSSYPISPRHARMLLAAIDLGGSLESESTKGLRLLAHATAAAAALSSESPFLREAFEESKKKADSKLDEGKEREMLDESKERKERLFENDRRTSANEAEEKERRKQLKSAARKAHAKFVVPGSEALSAVSALSTYEEAVLAAGERVAQTGPSVAGERFCFENHLHARTMREMAQLRQQLTRLVATNLGRDQGLQSVLESGLREKLSRSDEAKLRRSICAGWADRIARKLRPGEVVPGETEESKSRRAVRYQACSASGVVFLHPGSSMAKEAPDFVCYTDLVQTEKRTYMQGVTAVDVRWLPTEASALCQLSKPLADPPPWYEPDRDRIMCWVQPTFGPQQWTLPLHATELKPGKTKTAAFAVALLQGKVLRTFESLVGSLTGLPTDMLKPDAAGQKRVGEMLAKLNGLGVDSKETLRERWEQEPRFLFEELSMWVQAGKRGVLDEFWVGLLKEAGVGV